MKIVQMLKNRNRTLLELHTGILFWTIMASGVGMALPIHRWGMAKGLYLCSLWAAAVAGILSTMHMQHCLERALELDEKSASKIVTRGYLIRYFLFVAVAAVTVIVKIPDPLVFCLAYILLVKAAAYSQPFTHRFYNKLFHETDPVPEPVPDEEWDREKI